MVPLTAALIETGSISTAATLPGVISGAVPSYARVDPPASATGGAIPQQSFHYPTGTAHTVIFRQASRMMSLRP